MPITSTAIGGSFFALVAAATAAGLEEGASIAVVLNVGGNTVSLSGPQNHSSRPAALQVPPGCNVRKAASISSVDQTDVGRARSAAGVWLSAVVGCWNLEGCTLVRGCVVRRVCREAGAASDPRF
jgi:hypothetical protein